ncbi:LysR family transcriptional regulator [Streptomyces griseocarneus]|nr:LysR family transcriptional regulator [Streptomyces griseocarneus]
MAVAEERHFGRAATRLHMTQPPLSRAIKQLETELGTVLLHRSATAVSLTASGSALYDGARSLLEQAEQVRARVAAVAGPATLTLGILADSAEQAGPRLVAAFRRRHPEVRVRVREADLTDPTAGLRSGLVAVALTRAPFDETGISTRVLRSDPVGAVLRTDDPLARRDVLHLRDLADRRWFRLSEEADPFWRAFWNGVTPSREAAEGPVVRTVHECLQAVLWNGSVGLAPLTHALPEGLACVPVADMPTSDLVVAWNSADTTPLINSFTRIAATLYRSPAPQAGAGRARRPGGGPRPGPDRAGA